MSSPTMHPCPHCSSSDAYADYGDHWWCFSCNTRDAKEGESIEYQEPEEKQWAWEIAQVVALSLVPSDFNSDWVSKRGYGEKELDYLRKHPDFGGIDLDIYRGMLGKIQQAGGDTVAAANYDETIKKFIKNNDNFVIARDKDGNPASVQRFSLEADGTSTKRYLKGSRGADNFITFKGENDNVVFVGEGVATCLAAFFLLRKKYTVISCLDARGVLSGVNSLTEMYPTSQLILIGDDDCIGKDGETRSDDQNKGKSVATMLSSHMDAAFPLRKWELYDWDDVYRAVRNGSERLTRAEAVKPLTVQIKMEVDQRVFAEEAQFMSLTEAREEVIRQVKEDVAGAKERLASQIAAYEAEQTLGDWSAVEKRIGKEATDKVKSCFLTNAWNTSKIHIKDFAPGTGKTTACLLAIAEDIISGSTQKYEILAHTHERCEEIHGQLLKMISKYHKVGAGQIVHRVGMTEETCDDKVISAMISEGTETTDQYPARFCRGCKLSKICEYQRAKAQSKKAQVLISTHSFARYAAEEKDINNMPIVIIDEDPMVGLGNELISMRVSKVEGKEQEHRLVFRAALDYLSKEDDGIVNLKKLPNVPLTPSFLDPSIPLTEEDGSPQVSEVIKEAVYLSKELYAEWEAQVEGCVSDSGGSGARFAYLMKSRDILPYPPVQASFWGSLMGRRGSILKIGETIYIRNPPKFRRYTRGVDIIITDAKADPAIYRSIFNGTIEKTSYVDVANSKESSNFQVLQGNHSDLVKRGKDTLVKSIQNLLESRDSALISIESNLKDICEGGTGTTFNFARAMGTNKMEDKELLIVLSWPFPPSIALVLTAFNMFGEEALDNEWVSASEEIGGETIMRRHYPTNGYVQVIYNQLVKKPVFHAINRLRPIITGKKQRTTILISSQFVSEKLEVKKGSELGIYTDSKDGAIVGLEVSGHKSAASWGALIANEVRKSGKLQLKRAVIAKALGVSPLTVKKVGNENRLAELVQPYGIEVVEEPSKRKDSPPKRYLVETRE